MSSTEGIGEPSRSSSPPFSVPAGIVVEDVEEPEALKELHRLCESSRFNIQADVETNPTKKRKKRRKFGAHVVYSEFYTASSAEEGIGETCDWPDPNSDDPITLEFLQSWNSYWKKCGQEILWTSWTEKYRDYINPESDLVDYLKNVSVCPGDDSDSEEGEADVMKRRREITISFSDSGSDAEENGSSSGSKKKVKEEDADDAWKDTWDVHCLEKYSNEYTKFVEKNFKGGAASTSVDWEIKKYWHQRYKLFSKFDEGIMLDKESWYSVTPEGIAHHIASKFNSQGISGVVVDAFCGCGGNTIQFALMCDKVIAIDIDPEKIKYCRHNAKIYGVEDKIEFLVGDFMEIGPTLKADAVFLSPPWGGPTYNRLTSFNLKKHIPAIDGYELFETAKNVSLNVAYFLPKNINKNQIMQLAGKGNYVEIEKNIDGAKVKTVTAYYGQLVRMPEAEEDLI